LLTVTQTTSSPKIFAKKSRYLGKIASRGKRRANRRGDAGAAPVRVEDVRGRVRDDDGVVRRRLQVALDALGERRLEERRRERREEDDDDDDDVRRDVEADGEVPDDAARRRAPREARVGVGGLGRHVVAVAAGARVVRRRRAQDHRAGEDDAEDPRELAEVEAHAEAEGVQAQEDVGERPQGQGVGLARLRLALLGAPEPQTARRIDDALGHLFRAVLPGRLEGQTVLAHDFLSEGVHGLSVLARERAVGSTVAPTPEPLRLSDAVAEEDSEVLPTAARRSPPLVHQDWDF